MGQKICGRFIKTAFNVSGGSFQWNQLLEKNCFSRFFSGLSGFSFGVYAKCFWRGCRKCTLRVHMFVFMGSIFFENDTFWIVFRTLGGNVSGLQTNFSNTVVIAALFVSRGTFHEEKPFEEHPFFQFRKFVATFLEIWRNKSKMFVKTALYAPGGNIMRKYPLTKKNKSFSDTRRTFLWLLTKVFWQDHQNWTVHVQRQLCEKKTFGRNETFAISDNRRKPYKFSTIKFQQVCQKFYLCVVRKFIIKKIDCAKNR